MPTDFNWRDWKKKQLREQEPPPPEEPKIVKALVVFANMMLYVVLIVSLAGLLMYTNDASNTMKLIDKCNYQKGVAIRTLRGDAVCIKEEYLTDFLNSKHTNQIKP